MERPIIISDHHLSSSQFHQEILITPSLNYSQKQSGMLKCCMQETALCLVEDIGYLWQIWKINFTFP